MNEQKDFILMKIDEAWDMMHHDIKGLRKYAQEANEAFKEIMVLESTLKDSTGKYHGALKHWEEELEAIFKIARSFNRE